MPRYRLTHFNVKGRGEVTRLALSAAGQSFEDRRLTRQEWEKLKPDVPQHQLPILEVDGEVLCQSGAMLRFVAREHDLYGSNNMENTEVDTVLETMEDFAKEFIKPCIETDPEKRKELLKECVEKTVGKFAHICSRILCDNSGGDGWMVGSKLTVADISVYFNFDGISTFYGPAAGKSFMENAKLKAHSERVAAYPGVKEWLEKRPETNH